MALYKCVSGHWQGYEFIPEGAIFEKGDPRINMHFVEFDTGAPRPVVKKTAPRRKPPAPKAAPVKATRTRTPPKPVKPTPKKRGR